MVMLADVVFYRFCNQFVAVLYDTSPRFCKTRCFLDAVELPEVGWPVSPQKICGVEFLAER
jgi:hypothetical protein